MVAVDVTGPDSIAAARAESGHIDVPVNNAGIELLGAWEVTPMSAVCELFETNPSV